MVGKKALTFAENPLTARRRFQLRPLSNWVFCTLVFIAIASVTAIFVKSDAAWLLDAAAIAVLFYFNFYVLPQRPIKLRCPHCRKQIVANTPWVCPICSERNLKTAEFPFILKCEHCETETKAYGCPNCRETIFLTEDEDLTNVVFGVNSPQDIPKVDERANALKEYQEQKEDKAHEISIADSDLTLLKLKARYKTLQSQLEPPARKGPMEEKKESLKDFFESRVAAEEAARQQKAANAEECKGNQRELGRRNRIVADWLKNIVAGNE